MIGHYRSNPMILNEKYSLVETTPREGAFELACPSVGIAIYRSESDRCKIDCRILNAYRFDILNSMTESIVEMRLNFSNMFSEYERYSNFEEYIEYKNFCKLLKIKYDTKKTKNNPDMSILADNILMLVGKMRNLKYLHIDTPTKLDKNQWNILLESLKHIKLKKIKVYCSSKSGEELINNLISSNLIEEIDIEGDVYDYENFSEKLIFENKFIRSIKFDISERNINDKNLKLLRNILNSVKSNHIIKKIEILSNIDHYNDKYFEFDDISNECNRIDFSRYPHDLVKFDNKKDYGDCLVYCADDDN